MISCLHRIVSRAAEKWPDNKALIEAETGRAVTYKELNDAVAAFASCLARQGLKKGERAGILSPNSVASVAAFFAISRAGAIAVPFNYELDAAHIARQAAGCGLSALIHSGGFADKAKVIRVPLTLTLSPEGRGDLMDPSSEKRGPATSPSPRRGEGRGEGVDAALIIYTSGTTRRPIGVTLSHKNLISDNTAIAKYAGLTSDDKVCCVLPLHYIYGLSLLLSHFIRGGTVIIDNRFMYPNVVLDTIDKYKATGFAGVSGHYAVLLARSDFKNRPLGSLRYFMQAGDAMPPEVTGAVARAFPGKKLYLMYGLTEASPRLTYLSPRLVLKKPGSVGKAIPGVEVKVIGKNGRERGPGQTGEIIAKGDNIMMGYWNNAEATAGAIKRGWLYTGDMGFKDADGDLFITGRKTKVIKDSKLLKAIPKKLVLSLVLLAAMFAFSRDGLAKSRLPGRTRSWVNDYAGVIDAKTKAELERYLSSIPQRTPDPVEVIIATFSDLEGWTPEDFIVAYEEQWRLTKKGRDNGVVIIAFPRQGRISIGVGQNLKMILPTNVIDDIMNALVLPILDKDGYAAALKKAAEAVVDILNQAQIPADKPNILLFRIVALAVILLILLFIFRKVRISKR